MENEVFNNVITGLIVVIILVALVNLSVTVIKISKQNEEVTGLVPGYVNITISTSIVMNLSRDTIDFGAGGINGTWENATLYTRGDDTAIIIGGNWSATLPKAIVIQNLGTVNFSLNISAGKNASGFFGGTNPLYQWNISNNDTNSCGDSNWSLGSFVDINASTTHLVCNKFNFFGANHYMYLDVKLRIPSDINSTISSGMIIDTLSFIANPSI